MRKDTKLKKAFIGGFNKGFEAGKTDAEKTLKFDYEEVFERGRRAGLADQKEDCGTCRWLLFAMTITMILVSLAAIGLK